MNWAKVAHALDDEWYNRRKTAEMATDLITAQRDLMLSQIAFILRDCLVRGMDDEERKEFSQMEHTSAQVPGGPTCHPRAFWEASSPTTGVSLAVCSICKQPAKT